MEAWKIGFIKLLKVRLWRSFQNCDIATAPCAHAVHGEFGAGRGPSWKARRSTSSNMRDGN
jgi:hypothetical protein